MNIIDAILNEIELEAANTRKMLERAPQEKFAWQPHAKSMTLCGLVSHIAEIPTWVKPILEQDELVIDLEKYVPPSYASVAELLQRFDKNIGEAKEAMAGQSDERLMGLWRLKVGEQSVFELPRVAVLRGMILSHSVHHRGQLSVYLRLNDVPLPPLYGPTADEQPGH